MSDRVNASSWNAQCQSERIGTHVERNEKVLAQDFAGMGGTHSVDRLASAVTERGSHEVVGLHALVIRQIL